jgi:hypothetical protein
MENSNLKPKEIKVYEDKNNYYHKKMVEIWEMIKNDKKFMEMIEKYPKQQEIYEYAFAQDTLYKEGLLFLGIGASNGKKKNKYDENLEDTCDTHDCVQYETERGRIGINDKKPHDYYKPMIKLASETNFGINWSNIDITLFRETSQKKLVPFFKKLPEIMEKQLKLAIEIIIDTDPKIIIVSNALVRDILKNDAKKSKIKSSGFRFHFDDDIGTEIIDTPIELKGRPIFFTSMLSGAGTLDKGSFKRLKWHINYVNALLYENTLSSDEKKEYKKLFHKLYPKNETHE